MPTIRIEKGEAYTCDESGKVPPQVADMKYAVITESDDVSELIALFSDPRDASCFAEALVDEPGQSAAFAKHGGSIYEATPFILDALAND